MKEKFKSAVFTFSLKGDYNTELSSSIYGSGEDFAIILQLISEKYPIFAASILHAACYIIEDVNPKMADELFDIQLSILHELDTEYDDRSHIFEN